MSGAGGTAIGIDIGGTRIRAALVDGKGGILDHASEPVAQGRTAIADQLLGLIGAMAGGGAVGVGIGIPGRVDAAQGAILSAGYLDIAGMDLPALVAERHGLDARIENDATMALIAEAHARGLPGGGLDLMVTVGTGIGGAVLCDGEPWYGGGIAGQFGHLSVADDGPPCKCGRRGCVETFSSGTALLGLLEDHGLPADLPAAELTARADGGDGAAVAVLDRWAAPFHRALASLVAAFDPRLVIVGGGLGGCMTGALARIGTESPWFALPVAPATLGDRAGVIGAGLRGFPAGAG